MFYAFQYFVTQGDSCTKVGPDVQQAAPINLPNFVLYTVYCQPFYDISAAKFRRFRRRRDWQKQKQVHQ